MGEALSLGSRHVDREVTPGPGRWRARGSFPQLSCGLTTSLQGLQRFSEGRLWKMDLGMEVEFQKSENVFDFVGFFWTTVPWFGEGMGGA